MCFRKAKELHSELLGMLDEPDDAIRFEKPYLPERDFPYGNLYANLIECPRKYDKMAKVTKKRTNLLNTFEGIKENCTRRHWRC